MSVGAPGARLDRCPHGKAAFVVARYPITMPDVVERARALALTLLPSLEARAAILTGAPLAGLGTPTSDVDVHVVVADPPERPSRQFAVEDRRVDVRYWTAEQLNERIGLCSRYRFNEDDRDQLDQVSRYIIEPVVRFAMAEILLDDGTL